MRIAMAVLAALGLTACVFDPNNVPTYPPVPGPIAQRPIETRPHDKIPDTPYEIRKAEIDRDRQIAGQTGPTYPKLFKNQKDDDGNDGGQ